MIAQHTITHAIQYLRDAQDICDSSVLPMLDTRALATLEPGKPCAAYGLARRTLRRCGSLAGAIKDLEKQLEEA